MICKNLLTLATFLFITASAIKLALNEDDEPRLEPEPCQQVCPLCTEDPCPPCTSTCDDPTPPAAMESPANITIHLTAVGDQQVDDTILIDRIVHRPTELPSNTVLLPGDEVVDFDVHVYDKNGESQDMTLTVDHLRNHTAAGAPLSQTWEGAVDMDIHVVQALNGTTGEIVASDIWLSLDQFINGTVDMGPFDNGTNSTNITGGTCNNVQVGTWSYTYDGETTSGSYELCMDDCENAGGSVTIVTDA